MQACSKILFNSCNLAVTPNNNYLITLSRSRDGQNARTENSRCEAFLNIQSIYYIAHQREQSLMNATFGRPTLSVTLNNAHQSRLE